MRSKCRNPEDFGCRQPLGGCSFSGGTGAFAAKKAKGYLRFTVTVVNKSDKPLDLGLTDITVQSSNKESGQIFDTDNDLDSTPDTKVLKGRESEFDVGFGVTDPNDVDGSRAPRRLRAAKSPVLELAGRHGVAA
jgi:hypothetical protein